MKKRSLTATLFAVLGMASAPALAQGYYVQGDLGLVNLRAKTELKDVNSLSDLKKSYKESTVLPRVSVGYDFGSFRVAGDYTHYKKAKTSTASANSETKTQGLGVAAIYDIPMGLMVQPYVGARLAVNKVKQTANGKNFSSSSSETKLTPGLMAGFGYQIDRNTTIDAGYRYNHFDSKLKAHEATIGVRYSFQ